MQETRILGRTARAVALAAVVAITLSIAAPASALDPATRGDDGGVTAAFDALVTLLGDWIEKIGCEIDPRGRHCQKPAVVYDDAATTQSSGGACQQTQPGPPTTQIGCELDPHG